MSEIFSLPYKKIIGKVGKCSGLDSASISPTLPLAKDATIWGFMHTKHCCVEKRISGKYRFFSCQKMQFYSGKDQIFLCLWTLYNECTFGSTNPYSLLNVLRSLPSLEIFRSVQTLKKLQSTMKDNQIYLPLYAGWRREVVGINNSFLPCHFYHNYKQWVHHKDSARIF